MKKSWIILAIFCMAMFNNSYAQKEDKYTTQVRSLFWGADDKHGDDVEVPEKWKDESAVILFQEILYVFTPYGKKRFVESEGIRRRIKLQDQSAVDEYSEFTVDNPYKGEQNYYRKWNATIAELKIIKENGEVKEVDMNEGVKVEGGKNKQKIAVPGLVPGDILDFFYYTGDNKYIVNTTTAESSSPVISSLSASYPIVEQLIKFEVDKKYFFSGNAYNGAPLFKTKIGNEGQKIYYIEDKDREKEEEIRWYYEKIESPCVKYQAHVLRHEKKSDRTFNFLGDAGAQHKGLALDQYVERIKENVLFYAHDVSYEKEKKKGKGMEKVDFLNYLYQKNRFDKIGRYLEPILLAQNEIYAEFFLNFRGFPSSWKSAISMGTIFKKMKLPFEFLIVPRRSVSKFDNILMEEEVEYMIRADVDGETIYFPTWYTFNEFNRIPAYLEGAEALAVKVGQGGEIGTGRKINLPVSSYTNNNTLRAMKVDLSDLNADGFKTVRATKVIGLSKEYYQNNLITLHDHNSVEREYFGLMPHLDTKKQKAYHTIKGQKKYKEHLEQRKKQQFEKAGEILDREVGYDIKEFLTLAIESVGRLENKTLSFSESYLIDPNFIKRAGKNYLIPVGQLIDDQVAIQEEEKERSKNIYMPFARSFNYDIEVTLPEGYVVDGLDKLNKTVKNSTGGFVATATVEGDILTIKSEKWYEHNYEDVGKWPEMIEFLDAAFQFTQEKILLKKG